MTTFDAIVIGGGMITHDQLLPSLYQLQRLGAIANITVCARRRETLDQLHASSTIRAAFPDQSFIATNEPFDKLLAGARPRQLAVVAVPDPLHHDVIMTALGANQHVCTVKPLVMTVRHGEEIDREARVRGLFVGIDYHKRSDDRSLMARHLYRAGRFGEFRLGRACLHEKWNYRYSNFKNWCTAENSDAFSYIGCHYVDLVQFITGLEPVAVSVCAVRDRYDNGGEGFLWTDSRVRWSNGAVLNVQNSLGYPENGPGSNLQGLEMLCAAGDAGAMLRHSDQYRGLEYAPIDGAYSEPSPDYFQYVPVTLENCGPGLAPVGYGYRAIAQIVDACRKVEDALPERRAAVLEEMDRSEMIATPANSRHNDRVIEAARVSIFENGREVTL